MAWLRLTGCEHVFSVSAVTGAGLPELLDYLDGPGQVPDHLLT